MTTIAQNLNALGFAPVIAHIAGDGDEAAKVRKHFTAQPTSQLGSRSLAEKALAGLRVHAPTVRGCIRISASYTAPSIETAWPLCALSSASSMPR
jgi:hypothetical protein